MHQKGFRKNILCDKILKESIIVRAVKKRTDLQNVKLLWVWFFPIVPSCDRVAGTYMEIVFTCLFQNSLF